MNYPKLFSNKIVARTAPHLAGPWSEGNVIYRIPEMQKGNAGYDKDTFCYAAKEHPEFRRPGSRTRRRCLACRSRMARFTALASTGR
jgi:hypothetical protein